MIAKYGWVVEANGFRQEKGYCRRRGYYRMSRVRMGVDIDATIWTKPAAAKELMILLGNRRCGKLL